MNTSIVLASLYVLFNTACLIAYLPQVLQLCRSHEAREHVVVSMWGIWTLGAAIELLYAMDIGNHPWMWMAGGHLTACVIVTGFGAYGWLKKHNRGEDLPTHSPVLLKKPQ